jgi:hypothetical protein
VSTLLWITFAWAALDTLLGLWLLRADRREKAELRTQLARVNRVEDMLRMYILGPEDFALVEEQLAGLRGRLP